MNYRVRKIPIPKANNYCVRKIPISKANTMSYNQEFTSKSFRASNQIQLHDQCSFLQSYLINDHHSTKKHTNLKTTKFALVVLNTPPDSFLLLLWEEADMVVCADGGSNRIYDYHNRTETREKYIPHVILGDLDSARPEVLEYYKNRKTQILKIKDQNSTDLTKSLRYISKYNPNIDLVICYGAFGGRFDHEMGIVDSLFLCADMKYRIILLEEGNLSELLMPGKHKIVCHSRFEMIGTNCGLIPIGGNAVSVYTTGLKWNLNGEELGFGKLVSVCNIITSATIHVQTTHPLIWTTSFGQIQAVPKVHQDKSNL